MCERCQATSRLIVRTDSLGKCFPCSPAAASLSGMAARRLVRDEARQLVVQAQLLDAGPLRSGQIDDTSQVPWGSTGWTNNRNVTQMLELLSARGEVAVTGRSGRQRLWDLAERVYGWFTVIPPEDAAQQRARRRLSALGLARAKTLTVPGEPTSVRDVGVRVVVDGVEGEWRADSEALDQPFAGRTALLFPFDLTDLRPRAGQDRFGFEYVLVMDKPAAKRRWGYLALPVLHHDRLVGKLDAKTDRKAATLTVHALHEDVRFTRRMRADVEAEIDGLAYWLGVTRLTLSFIEQPDTSRSTTRGENCE